MIVITNRITSPTPVAGPVQYPACVLITPCFAAVSPTRTQLDSVPYTRAVLPKPRAGGGTFTSKETYVFSDGWPGVVQR
jgi:hypothetical protein